MITLNALLTALTKESITTLDRPISSVVIDSREASSGSLFIALPGERVNGHDFVQEAFDHGAQFALIDQPVEGNFHTEDLRQGCFKPERFTPSLPICLRVDNTLQALQTLAAYWREQHALRVIGITGSVGKTSTKELAAALLSQKFTVLKNPGNRNNEIGLPLTVLELDKNHDCAVLEMGFYVPGEIQILCSIARPHVGLVTNIGTVHAERAGSQEAIARGKAELVESLPADGVAILNLDDPWVRQMQNQTRARVLTYAVNQNADLTASAIQSQGLQGISCQVHYQGESHPIHSPLLGEFSVYTLLAATAVALSEGLSWEEITTGLSQTRVDLRMRYFTLPDGIVILDDSYNAAPESTSAALKLLQSLQGRRVAILGDMLELGPYEQQGHQAVGKMAALSADLLILVGERSRVTAKAALENGFAKENLHWFKDSSQASIPSSNLIQPGDVVLVKGSNSMHMDLIVNALEVKP